MHSFYHQDSNFPHEKKPSIKVKYTPAEDERLISIIEQIGTKDWLKVAKLMKTRNARQCRERWNNYLNPALINDPWTPEEDALLEEKFKEYGAGWNTIAKFFKGRSDNSLRNRHMKLMRAQKKQGKKVAISAPVPVAPIIVPPPQIKKQEVIVPENSSLFNFPEIELSNTFFDSNSFDLMFEGAVGSWL